MGPPSFPDDGRALPRYRSRRLGLSLALPDGKSWRIDDHSTPALVATHAPTQSKVVVAVLHADALVGRTECEALARASKIVALPVPDRDRTIDDDVTVTSQSFDTRVRVSIAESPDGAGRLAGHVTAFGGFLRKCYVFDFSTAVDRATDEEALASRLALVRTRVLPALAIDELGNGLPRESRSGPESGPVVPRSPAP